MSRFTSLYPGGARCASKWRLWTQTPIGHRIVAARFVQHLGPVGRTHRWRGKAETKRNETKRNVTKRNVTDSAHVSSEVFDGEREDGAVLRGAQQLAVRLVGLGAVAGAQQRR